MKVIPRNILSKVTGKRIRELRTEAGLSQQALADAVGVSVVTINRIENCVQFPEWDTIVSIADALNVPVDFLRKSEIGA